MKLKFYHIFLFILIIFSSILCGCIFNSIQPGYYSSYGEDLYISSNGHYLYVTMMGWRDEGKYSYNPDEKIIILDNGMQFSYRDGKDVKFLFHLSTNPTEIDTNPLVWSKMFQGTYQAKMMKQEI